MAEEIDDVVAVENPCDGSGECPHLGDLLNAEHAIRHLAADNEYLRRLTEGDPTSVYHEAAASRAENQRLRAWAQWVLDIKGDEPCRYDHHGYCQAHNLDEKPCPVEQIAAYFASEVNPDG